MTTMTPIKTGQEKKTKMRLTAELGADFWNDSCAVGELADAVDNGAVGATSNPVIVYGAVTQEGDRWLPVLDRIVKHNPSDTEEGIAWKLVETIGKEAAALLEPVYERTKGAKGFLSMQVNPQLYRSKDKMVAHAKRLASVARNVAIKMPATETGLAAMEEVVAAGINVNATVSFSVPQALAVAEVYERALKRAETSGVDMDRMHPYVTIMVGRVDDHLKRLMAKEKVSIDPGLLEWAGVAVFKRAYQLFKERGCKGTLLAAAYRNVMQWSELIGPDLILTLPYAWWNQFNASDVVPERTIEKPLDPKIVETLLRSFPDFRRAYEPDGMRPSEFVRYGASVNTLDQFLGGYQKLLDLVRGRMLA